MTEKPTTKPPQRDDQTSAQSGPERWGRAEFLSFIQAAYDVETRESIHIYQRCGFILTASVILASIAVALLDASWIEALLSRTAVAFYLGVVILVFAALAVVIVMLICTLVARTWVSVPQDAIPFCSQAGICHDGKPNAEAEHDVRLNDETYPGLVIDLANAVDKNRSCNTRRYGYLNWAIFALVAAVVLLFVQLVIHGIVYLTNL